MDEKYKYIIVQTKENIIDRMQYDNKIDKLLNFFQFKTNNSSAVNEYINKKYKFKLYEELIKIWQGSYSRNEIIFIEENDKSKSKKVQALELSGENIRLLYKKAIFTYKKSCSNSQKFDCIMRHIRNSIAHNRVYINKELEETTFLFIDKAHDNKTITAKFICTLSDLRKWRRVIEKYITISFNE